MLKLLMAALSASVLFLATQAPAEPVTPTCIYDKMSVTDRMATGMQAVDYAQTQKGQPFSARFQTQIQTFGQLCVRANPMLRDRQMLMMMNYALSGSVVDAINDKLPKSDGKSVLDAFWSSLSDDDRREMIKAIGDPAGFQSADGGTTAMRLIKEKTPFIASSISPTELIAFGVGVLNLAKVRAIEANWGH